ncbi:hypothetical protein K6V92_10280 [Cupriavidus respiraculi]|uniref:hypothetical protein n=1 Tax=Cupriavidus respiraculi TaxID=195930 RepID=UPI001C956205|nr:hypothetical protein [Cupriavidus respiraculi]MBY4947005.1 hypothetical protein [Cupriavidus respiraculi]
MKASITDLGVLVVTPETPLETFALNQWAGLAFAGAHTVENETNGETFTLLRPASLIVNGNTAEPKP